MTRALTMAQHPQRYVPSRHSTHRQGAFNAIPARAAGHAGPGRHRNLRHLQRDERNGPGGRHADGDSRTDGDSHAVEHRRVQRPGVLQLSGLSRRCVPDRRGQLVSAGGQGH